MKHNINKELFEAVYNCDITADKDMLGVYKRINIYEFAFKCKEWAFNQGYSYIGNNKLLNIYREDSQMICIINKDIINWFDINVDFIACEWILKELNENKQN